ncbi:MAG: LlaJI family restriction endonuclease, partial [Coprobacillaceae bacterium]
MVSVYIQELEEYTFDILAEKLGCLKNEDHAIKIISMLSHHKVLKLIDKKKLDSDLSELNNESVSTMDLKIKKNDYFYVFPIVGVITVLDIVLKCYPKYISTNKLNDDDFKKVLKVVKKYKNSKKQVINMNNVEEDSENVNLLATILFFLNDYYENGIYINTQDIIEINGSGDILWDKTINETFTLISNNRPYYPNLLTRKRVNDEYDYFKRLHECILTECSLKLEKAGLDVLFDIMGVNSSDENQIDLNE